MLIDPNTMKCINVELFKMAAKLGDVMDDRSSVGAMKDSYAIALFSWETFTKLISQFRFDGALYIIPFLYMLLSTRSKTLCREDRLKMLELSIKIFYFHLNSVLNSKPNDFFTPTYKESSIGTLFGDYIYIIRCINTAISFAVALINNDDFAFSRVGTHDVEIFFGLMRIISHFNNTFDNAVYTAVKSILIDNLCDKLNFKITIRSRDNEGGANLTEEILNSECANTDFTYILDTLFLLFRSVKLSDTQLKTFQILINNFTQYLEINGFKGIHIQSIYSGCAPYKRYITNSYALSLAPIPLADDQISVFTFFKKDFFLNKKIEKLSSQQWFLRLLATMLNLETISGSIQSIMFPIIPYDTPSATVFNIISEWLENFLTNKLPGEINQQTICFESEGKSEKPSCIIRTNSTFDYIESDALPVNSKGVPIQIPELNDEDDQGKNYISKSKSNDIPKSIDLQPLPSSVLNGNIFASLYSDIRECVDDFIRYRTPDLKAKTKLIVKNRLMDDLKSITNFLINNKDDDLVPNNINSINLYHCIEGKKIDAEKMKKIDEKADYQVNEERKIDRYSFCNDICEDENDEYGDH